MAVVARVRVPRYVDVEYGSGHLTLYPIEAMYENGKLRKVTKRYSDVLGFHQTVLKAAPHAALEGFNFPHKSVFNTNAEFTKERRRSGFEEYFELLLRLGPEYAPFLATFLKEDNAPDEFEELGELSQDDAGSKHARDASQRDDFFKLARPTNALQWLVEFYLPVALVSWAYSQILTLLGCLRPTDWGSGAAWLAIATSPLVLTIALALLAPVCDSDLEPSDQPPVREPRTSLAC
ncbi:hypothetical protein CTAYLR_004390 [Chrysophaeum taylorii]|uniref:PX domain-containing protein n=1 Tax=Chrysophaeum taylorii TaxID=2483200 RepID=A0AAD7UNB9_9STRA|nr:hypothetical protein CTAYLR_004390 [Chrysophaeum taylorii]